MSSLTINNLAKKSLYLNKDLKYLKNTIITEYDMKSAGYSILKDHNVFSKEEIEYIDDLPKLDRNILLGKFLKENPDLLVLQEEGFVNARKIFLEKNNINPFDVLSVKRDAFFIIGNHNISKDITDNVKIYPKNKFTTYINILNREHYYNTETQKLVVKGYGKNSIDIMEKGLFTVLKKILDYDVQSNKDLIFLDLIKLKDELLTYNLPKEYYYDCLFEGYSTMNYNHSTVYSLDYFDENMIESLDLTNNIRFINELISYTL